MTSDPLTAELEEIGQRCAAVFDDPAGRKRPDLVLAVRVAEDDAPRLLAALDKVLERHYPASATGSCIICAEPYPCREVQAIARVLLGEAKTGG